MMNACFVKEAIKINQTKYWPTETFTSWRHRVWLEKDRASGKGHARSWVRASASQSDWR